MDVDGLLADLAAASGVHAIPAFRVFAHTGQTAFCTAAFGCLFGVGFGFVARGLFVGAHAAHLDGARHDAAHSRFAFFRRCFGCARPRAAALGGRFLLHSLIVRRLVNEKPDAPACFCLFIVANEQVRRQTGSAKHECVLINAQTSTSRLVGR